MTGVITAVAVAAVATGASVISNNKARKAQERAGRVQQAVESRGAQRDRLQQLRQAQVARAQAIQSSVSSGTADSSGLSGQLANIQSTAAGNLAFSQMTETGVGVINQFNRRAARYQSQAGTYSAVSSLALASAGAMGGITSGGGSTPTSAGVPA